MTIQDEKYWESRPENDPKKDWKYDGTWLEGYEKSVDHPHRKIVLKHLRKIDSLLEIGCNCGPNLIALNKKNPNTKIYGIDINYDAIERAKVLVPRGRFTQGNFIELPYQNGSFDAVLADAVLMYVPPGEILDVLGEMDRVSNGKIVIVDRFAHSRLGIDSGFIWYRNYDQLLEELGMKVFKYKLKKEDWPHSVGWERAGYVWVGSR